MCQRELFNLWCTALAENLSEVSLHTVDTTIILPACNNWLRIGQDDNIQH